MFGYAWQGDISKDEKWRENVDQIWVTIKKIGIFVTANVIASTYRL